MPSVAPIRATRHGNTGEAGYDAIAFAGEPIVDLVSAPGSIVSILRHGGQRCTGMAATYSRNLEHDTILLKLTSGGRYRGRVGGRAVDKVPRRGQVSFIPAGRTVDIEHPATNSVLIVQLCQTYLRRVLLPCGAPELRSIHCERNDRLAQLIVMLESETRTPGFASDLLIDGLMRAIASTIARHEQPLVRPKIDRIRLSLPKLHRVTEFVDANLEHTLALGDMAKVAGLSPFHFSRVFKLATGETPYHFLSSRRLERARRLLTEGDMPLVQLALSCGFASQSHFTAAFTKAMGVSPGRYRRDVRG